MTEIMRTPDAHGSRRWFTSPVEQPPQVRRPKDDGMRSYACELIPDERPASVRGAQGYSPRLGADWCCCLAAPRSELEPSRRRDVVRGCVMKVYRISGNVGFERQESFRLFYPVRRRMISCLPY
jgi:hypothetical protein